MHILKAVVKKLPLAREADFGTAIRSDVPAVAAAVAGSVLFTVAGHAPIASYHLFGTTRSTLPADLSSCPVRNSLANKGLPV